jgi:hypothetical protein
MATPIKVKKVIVYYDQVNPKNEDKNPAFSILTYESDKVVDYPFLTGKNGIMVPKSFKQVGCDTFHQSMLLPSMHGKIMAGLGRHGLLLFRVRAKHQLKNITINPVDLDVNLHFDEESLIYSFNNSTGRYSVEITFEMTNDGQNIREQLASDPYNLSLRKKWIDDSLHPSLKIYYTGNVTTPPPNLKYTEKHFIEFVEIYKIEKNQVNAFDLLCKRYPRYFTSENSFLTQFRKWVKKNRK